MDSEIDLLIRSAAGTTPAAVRAAGRLMTLVAGNPALLDTTGKSTPGLVAGITGAPGSGKSTLTNALISCWRQRLPEERLGVIAVDPSSPFTQGAVLGDRVRMMSHATDPKVFVRSVASRGHLGGLAAGVREMVRAMSLIGIRTVLLETVGVGQSEVEIAEVADLVLLVLSPGQGDSVQLLKAGVIEIADIIVVNKSDCPGAEELYSQVLAHLRMFRSRKGGVPRVECVSASENRGIDRLVDAIEKVHHV